MTISINSATLENYNANNRGKNVGDCVKRSMSLAFDLPYSEISKLLNNKMHETRKSAWNVRKVFEPVIEELGASKYNKIADEAITLEEFVDNRALPNEIYILLVGKKPGSTGHMVCVRDSKIWDSWDSRDRYVDGYWIVDNSNPHKALTDIKDRLVELAKEYVYKTEMDELKKQTDKYDMEGRTEYKGTIVNYTLKQYWKLILDPDEFIDKERRYNFQIAIPITPTMTEEEAIKTIQTVGKIRMYDRIYSINQQEKKLKEEYIMRSKLKADSKKLNLNYLTDQEIRFYKSLPGWAKALVYYIDIQNPGQYSDSYTIKLHKLPDDPNHPDEDSFKLTDYEAWGIKNQLDRYKEKFEIEGIDYYKDW